MDNERDPNRQNEEAADASDEAIKGRAEGEEEIEDTDDIDEDADAEDSGTKLDASE